MAVDVSKYTNSAATSGIQRLFTAFEADFGVIDPDTFRDELYDKEINLSSIKNYIIAAYYFYYFIKTNDFSDPTFYSSTAHHIAYKFVDKENVLHKFWFDTDHDAVSITLTNNIWLRSGPYKEVTKRFVDTIDSKII